MNGYLTEIDELCSAEEFLDHFDIAYDRRVVEVNRLHILQRFHDYLGRFSGAPDAADCARMLGRAYADFVHSTAGREKVFAVFRAAEPREVHVSLTQLTGAG